MYEISPNPEMPSSSRRHSKRIVFKRLRQGLYMVAGTGVASVVGGYFVADLEPWTIVAVLSLSLLAACLGVLIEIVDR